MVRSVMVYRKPRFLTAEESERIRAEILSSARSVASVGTASTGRVDRKSRSSERAQVSPATATWVHARLNALGSDLAEHFGLELGECEAPHFLLYRPGDFFRRHADSGGHPDDPPLIKARAVSAVVFLNAQGQAPRGGGYLKLHTAGSGTGAQTITAEPGLLVAFPSKVLHEVTPLTEGTRATVVTWYPGARKS
jgi:predicted 2-oxoglutarate/Fe(II)-dependent dioxygenase YbiX